VKSLTARLQGHVPGEVTAAEWAWWTPPRSAQPLAGRRTWRQRVRAPRRDAQLAEIVGHLAVLVALGAGLPEALRSVAADGRGAMAGDLAVVAGWVRDGLPVQAALRRWAATTSCAVAGRLAAAVAGPPDDLVARLDDLAAMLHRRAHDRRVAGLAVASQVVWLASLLAVAVAVATVM
jgi:type II secretory pathway component PulF